MSTTQTSEATPLVSVEEAQSVAVDEEYDGEEEEEQVDLEYGVEALGAVLRPVLVTMVAAASLVAWLKPPSSAAVVWAEDDENEATGAKVAAGFANAAAIVAVILVATCCVVGLYWCGCTSFLRGYMMFSSATLLGVLGGGLAAEALEKLQVRLDACSFFFLLVNWAALGVAAIYSPEVYGLPQSATRAYLVAAAVVLAWHLSTYPPVTTWCALIALALYDVFAVLAPCGPLNALVKLMATRREPLPGLLYEAEVHTPEESGDRGRRPPPEPVKLGLGDFVFFSVLVANDVKQRGLVPAAAATVACLVGLSATLVLLAVARRALPALPISIALGVAFSFLADYALLPLLAVLSDRGIRV